MLVSHGHRHSSNCLLQLLFFCLIMTVYQFRVTFASIGDRSKVFRKCYVHCVNSTGCERAQQQQQQNLTTTLISEQIQREFAEHEGGGESAWWFEEYLQQWRRERCFNDCRYGCMWTTVDYFYITKGRVPQFHGKWPFVEVFGLQEPASVVFSALNLASFLYFLQSVQALPPNTPYKSIWRGYAMVCVFTWVCAVSFHANDTNLTEKLDYFTAFGAVLYGLFACVIRVFYGGRPSLASMSTLAVFCALYFGYHVAFLTVIRFDYAYNMRVNIYCGLATSVMWMVWLLKECYFDIGRWAELKFCAVVVVLGNVFLLLEVLDFAPLMWTFDAHSLWHFTTAPLPILWARFVVADCMYLRRARLIKKL